MPGDYDVRVTASLLDRLIDTDFRSSRDVEPSRADSVRELKRAVQRDLESLLNARNPHPDLPQSFAEAWQSVLTYGLPDFSVGFTRDDDRVKQIIQNAIRTFEPRLANPTVTIAPSQTLEPTITLRIDARLIMDPAPEPVSFDVVLPRRTVRSQVQESS